MVTPLVELECSLRTTRWYVFVCSYPLDVGKGRQSLRFESLENKMEKGEVQAKRPIEYTLPLCEGVQGPRPVGGGWPQRHHFCATASDTN